MKNNKWFSYLSNKISNKIIELPSKNRNLVTNYMNIETGCEKISRIHLNVQKRIKSLAFICKIIYFFKNFKIL